MLVPQGQSDVVEAVQQAIFAEGINVEVGAKPIGVGDGLILETNS